MAEFDIESIMKMLPMLSQGMGAAQGQAGSLVEEKPQVPSMSEDWASSYQPDIGPASVMKQLAMFNRGSSTLDRGMPNVSTFIGADKNYSVPAAAPAEVYGAVTPSDTPRASAALGTPAPPPTGWSGTGAQ